jgi:hypothetical protein
MNIIRGDIARLAKETPVSAEVHLCLCRRLSLSAKSPNPKALSMLM